MMPEAKVIAGGLGGAVSVIFIWIISAYGNVEFPPEVAAAVTAVVGTVVAYLTSNPVDEVEVELVDEDGGGRFGGQ